MRLIDLLHRARARGIDARDAEILVGHALGRPRAWLRAWPERDLDAAALAACEALLARRAAGVPVAYLTGSREFWSFALHVNEHTLIPRPDTETLVEAALARAGELAARATDGAARVLDLGTGSGAVAIAVAREQPAWHVTATDISEETLRVAAGNARRLRVRLACLAGDWWGALAPESRFDLILSNPPYVAAGDVHLGVGDLRFEPPQALVSGADGLDALRVISAGAPARLHAGGWLMVEHGHDQGPAVRELFHRAGLTQVATRADLAGRERVTEGRRGPERAP